MNKKILLPILILFFSGQIFAQGGRLLVLKDKGVIVHSYTKGSFIHFKFSNQSWVTGYIDQIQNDSIQVNQFVLQPGYTAYGTWGEDTMKLGLLTLHVSEILAFAHEKGHYTSSFSNGAFFSVAGPLYAGLNITNSLIHNDAVLGAHNLPHIVGGAAAWLFGRWLAKRNPNYRPIGKRFSVAII
ncbi:MAG: hypothetical protein RLZ56_239 [Bacteroidota bacterium]